MEKIIFSGSEKTHSAKVSIFGHIATLTFVDEQPTDNVLVSGFYLVNEHNLLPQRDCTAFNTIYRKMEGSVQLSDDGSEYQKPRKDVVVDVVWDDSDNMDGLRPKSVDISLYQGGKKVKTESATNSSDWKCVFANVDATIGYEIKVKDIAEYEVSIDGDKVTEKHEPLSVLKQNKIEEMNEAQQEAIQRGTDVVMSDGTVEHFTLTDHDQTSIIALAFQVAQGAEKIPWHTSNHEEGCKYYSAEDMNKLVEASMFAATKRNSQPFFSFSRSIIFLTSSDEYL